VSTAANPAGLLLVMEDLHDADDGSLQLLTHLGQSVTREPTMVVLTHRTETAPPALVRLRSVLLSDRRTVDLRLVLLRRFVTYDSFEPFAVVGGFRLGLPPAAPD
jgi:hypothetical protein